MLFKSAAKEVVDQMFILAQKAATDERKENSIKRLSYYHDEMDDYVVKMLEKHHTEAELFEPCFFNITKKIINQLAQVYLQDANRSLGDATDSDNKIYENIVKTSNINAKMKITSRYCKLLKTLLVRPIWRNNKMDLDVLTGDILDVSIGDVPSDLRAVMITHYPENGKIADITYSLWTDAYWQKLDHQKNVLTEETNPYGITPFIPIWDAYPALGSFWQPGGNDIERCQEAINAKLTDLLLVIEYQGFGTPVMRGVPSGSQLAFGPHTAVEITDPQGDFHYAKSNAPITQILNSIEFLAKQVAITNGLSAQSMSVKPTQESGLSRIAGSAELLELRKDSISLFGDYERQLFDMQKLIWNTHNTEQISESSRLKLDFWDPTPVMSPDKQAELWARELEMGTISRLDIIMIKNPDLSKEDAIDKLKEIQEEKKLYSDSSTETLIQERI